MSSWHRQARHKRQKVFSPQLFQQETYLLRKYETSDCTQIGFCHHCAWLRTAIGWYEVIRLIISVTKKRKHSYIYHTITFKVLSPYQKPEARAVQAPGALLRTARRHWRRRPANRGAPEPRRPPRAFPQAHCSAALGTADLSSCSQLFLADALEFGNWKSMTSSLILLHLKTNHISPFEYCKQVLWIPETTPFPSESYRKQVRLRKTEGNCAKLHSN